MTAFAQRSFAAGEISPSLYARTDLTRYQTGLRTCRNMIVRRGGGVSNRSGTEFCREVKTSSVNARLIPFSYSDLETYVLEFGNGYIRFYQNGALLAPVGAVAWSGVLPYTAGAIVTYLGNTYYAYVNTGTGNPAANPSQWYLLPDPTIFEIPSPYSTAQLPDIHFAQERHIMTLTHPSVRVYELARSGATGWTMLAVSFLSSISPPLSLAVSAVATTTGNTTSGSRVLTTVASTAAIAVGNYITVSTGMPAGPFKVLAKTASSLTLDKAATSTTVGATIATTNGSVGPVTYWAVTAVQDEEEGDPIFLNATDKVPIAESPTPLEWAGFILDDAYNVYRSTDGVSYGWVGSSALSPFSDVGNVPNYLRSFPTGRLSDFDAVNEYPATVMHYQQRRFFARSNNETETGWGSTTRDPDNFGIRFPLQDDDSVSFKMSGKKANPIKHMLDLGRLIVFTENEEKFLEGDQSGIIKPDAINPRKLSSHGCGRLRPLEVDDSALFVQARGTLVRDLKPISADAYQGTDLTVWAQHLFDGFTLNDWDYSESPHSIVWIARNDGILLGLSYLREHEIWGWHRHDTDGVVENVCVVPEGNEDRVYLIVKRTINGAVKRYVERFAPRFVSDQEEMIFMDSAASYDGWNAAATTIILTTAGGWTDQDLLTATASAAAFAAGDVGNVVILRILDTDGEETDRVRLTISSFTSSTVVKGFSDKTVPAGLRTTAKTTWALAKKIMTGLSHLEGKSLSVLGDGYVVASPNNADPVLGYPTVTVSAGQITLPMAYAKIKAGLPYISDIVTLDLDVSGSATIKDKKMLINRLGIYLEASRGVWAGMPDQPTEDAPLRGLQEYKARSEEDYGDPITPKTDYVEIGVEARADENGRQMIRQVDPLPLTVLALMPMVK